MPAASTAEESAILDAIDRNIPIEMTFEYEQNAANHECYSLRVSSATADNASLDTATIHSLWESGKIQMSATLDFKNRRLERRAP